MNIFKLFAYPIFFVYALMVFLAYCAILCVVGTILALTCKSERRHLSARAGEIWRDRFKGWGTAAILMAAASCFSADVSFTWTASPTNEQVLGYRFYDVSNPTNRVLLGIVTTNYFTVTNWPAGQGRSFGVSASNFWEGPISVPCVIPPAPAAPANLVPVPLSMAFPTSGVIEISRDLQDWRERIRFIKPSGIEMTNTSVVWMRLPTEPMEFLRPKVVTTTQPLIPGR